MVSGFSTGKTESTLDSQTSKYLLIYFCIVAGTVLLAYISYGAQAQHLVTASVMAAPGSLFFSKLFWPETETSLTSSDNIQLEKSCVEVHHICLKYIFSMFQN